MPIVPSTRFFLFKAFLMRLAGLNVSPTARLVSSVRVKGIRNLEIGSNTFVGHNTLFIGAVDSHIKIGNNCDISSGVTFCTGSHEINTVYSDRIAGRGISGDIIVGNGCWIGLNSTILQNVKIGDMSIIAAGAVVCSDVPPFTIVGGVPAKVIRFLK